MDVWDSLDWVDTVDNGDIVDIVDNVDILVVDLLYICRFLLWAQSPRYFLLLSDEGARENNVRGPGTTLKIGRYTIFPYDTSIRGQRWLETCVVLNFPPFCQILAKIRDKKSPDLFFIRNRENSHRSIFREGIGIRLLWRESELSWPSNRVFV